MNIQQAIKAVIAKQDLNEGEMHDVMTDIMTGKTTDAQIGAFLVGLSMKGETVAEITASAKVMRSLAKGVVSVRHHCDIKSLTVTPLGVMC